MENHPFILPLHPIPRHSFDFEPSHNLNKLFLCKVNLLKTTNTIVFVKLANTLSTTSFLCSKYAVISHIGTNFAAHSGECITFRCSFCSRFLRRTWQEKSWTKTRKRTFGKRSSIATYSGILRSKMGQIWFLYFFLHFFLTQLFTMPLVIMILV